MVHALEEIHRLLKTSGFLIDIHPVPHWLFLRAMEGETLLAVEPRPHSYSQDVLHAEEALAQVIRRGLYVVEQSDEFDYFTHAGSVTELRQHCDQINAYDDGPQDEQVMLEREEQFARFEAIMQAAGEGAEVLVHERARITRMRRNSRKE
jgi:hypothetical protein